MGHPTSQAQLHSRSFKGAVSREQLHRRREAQLQYSERLNQGFFSASGDNIAAGGGESGI